MPPKDIPAEPEPKRPSYKQAPDGTLIVPPDPKALKIPTEQAPPIYDIPEPGEGNPPTDFSEDVQSDPERTVAQIAADKKADAEAKKNKGKFIEI